MEDKKKKELNDEVIKLSATKFFKGVKYLKGVSANLSQKAFSRAFAHALNANLTPIDIKLRSPAEEKVSQYIQEILEYRTVLMASVLNEQLNEEKEGEKK